MFENINLEKSIKYLNLFETSLCSTTKIEWKILPIIVNLITTLFQNTE